MAKKFVVNFDQNKGKYLQCTERIHTGETILEECPLVSSQYLWNAELHYDACQQCLRPLETAQQTVSRLTKSSTIILPYMNECCETRPENHVTCPGCYQQRYCSQKCLEDAWNNHHKILCPRQHPQPEVMDLKIKKLCEAWRSVHYPPETASIMLLVKILARIKLEPVKFMEKLRQFSCNTVEESQCFIHKLCGERFRNQIFGLRGMVSDIFQPDDPVIQSLLTEDGFKSMLAMIGKNGQGIGTNAFTKWAENVERFVANKSPEEAQRISKLIESIFEKMEEVTGSQFLNVEGSGLYEIHSCLNHSCEPNAEVRFPHNNFVLAVRALEPIEPGEEITICYLDECWSERSRHSRQKYLQENYLFRCNCRKCQRQINDPDVTSDEDDSGSEDSDVQSDQEMNCD